ncbi:membrane protein [Arthrobacter phage Sicarius2]|uniref:Membrane protein n=1 Tax=Arthrobacter phage Sicarius2 TaxID=2836090 RepID=A0A8F3E5Q0_9CAUD|nr:membrane protein [Arthrobacter phage Sicarius2]
MEAWLMNTATPWAILGGMVLAVLTGRLIVPMFFYREIKADRDRVVATNESLTRAVGVFADALPDLLEVGKTTETVMTNIREQSKKAESDA